MSISKWLMEYVVGVKDKPHQVALPDYIHEYVWKGAGSNARRIGVIVGIKRGDNTHIGWSKVNTKAGDEFDRTTGINEALKKAAAAEPNKTYPPRFKRQLTAFEKRCNRYFKGCNVIKVVE